MRRIVRGIVTLVFFAAPCLPAQAARVDSTRATTKSIATLRATASAKSKALATIPLGSIVRVGKCRSGWCAAQYGKVHGEVSQSALRIGIAIVTLPSTGKGYTNSRGNVVPSPQATPDGKAPAGASAQCRDGTYSFSQSRSGTCSHHGGVSKWL